MSKSDQPAGVAVDRGVRPCALVYALQAPSGLLVPETVTHERRQAWVNAYDYLCRIDAEFGRRYWKKWDASQRAARKRGWRVVRAQLVAVAKADASMADAARFRWLDEVALSVDMVADPDNLVQVWHETLSGHPTTGRTLREAVDEAMKRHNARLSGGRRPSA